MKIQADLTTAREKIKQLENEISCDPSSLTKQFQDQTNLINDLNSYIQTKVGLESVLKT